MQELAQVQISGSVSQVGWSLCLVLGGSLGAGLELPEGRDLENTVLGRLMFQSLGGGKYVVSGRDEVGGALTLESS